MKRSIFFVSAVFVLGTLPAIAQTVSQVPALSPFKIEPGSTFSASVERRPAPELGLPSRSAAADRIVGDLSAALDLIRRHHVSGRSLVTKDVTSSSINGMLAELDPHSTYYDAAEFKTLLGEQESEYSGTGSTISNFIENGQIETYVIATQSGSAAARANLRYGDRIVSVNGSEMRGASAALVRDRIRGPRGTTVRIVVERAGRTELETIELKRERIVQPSIPDFFMLRDGTAYIDMSDGFSHTTSVEMETALRELARRGMRSLVLDLRENSGGILEQAVRVAERFLPAGRMIISQRGRNPFDNMTWRSENRASLDLPLVVLVNEHTASASEIVAGALQDNDRALILGQNTFGKGLVQTVVGLPGGAGLTLTTARYYTPAGRSVQRSYSGAGFYDYFKHRQSGSEDEKKEARTITNRRVFGGAGITPDEITGETEFTIERAILVDPIFFFVRGLLHGRPAGRESVNFESITPEEFDRIYLPLFRTFAMSGKWNVDLETLDNESAFISEQLRYDLALASAGSRAARRKKIESDPAVAGAIAAMPRATALAESARRLSNPIPGKKPARVAFPGGSR
jgi:carboxyl-terminal processing protease